MQALNDLDLSYHAEALKTLREGGVDEAMARHIAHLFIRDPLVIYEHDVRDMNPGNGMHHFDNIQSTNWQTGAIQATDCTASPGMEGRV